MDVNKYTIGKFSFEELQQILRDRHNLSSFTLNIVEEELGARQKEMDSFQSKGLHTLTWREIQSILATHNRYQRQFYERIRSITAVPTGSTLQDELMEHPTTSVSVSNWIITHILLLIPFANILFLLIWAFSKNTHPSKANWAKANLIIFAFMIGITILFFIVLGIDFWRSVLELYNTNQFDMV